MKTVLQYRAGPSFRNQLSSSAPDGIDVVVVDEADKESFAAEMRDTDVLFHVLEPVTAQVIAEAPNLKLIQKFGIGLNTIDLDAARESNILVSNMPGTNSQAVAEMALALIFSVLRRVPVLNRAICEGRGWTLDVEALDGIGEISGRTVGLVGYGEVPRRLAPVLAALGAEVIYTNRQEKPDAVGEMCSLEELLARSDIVSLHVPLTDATAKMIDAAAIERMKPGSVLINTARGGLVDEAALYTALTSGRIQAAGLDTFVEEPTPATNPLFTLDNVVAMPHVAWLTEGTLARSLGIAFENCLRVQRSEPLLHQVIP